MGTVLGCSVVPSFFVDGVTEPLVFPSIFQGSAAATTSFSRQVHVQVHHLWTVFHLKNPSRFSLQEEGFLDARCHPVFYGNYHINCNIILLLKAYYSTSLTVWGCSTVAGKQDFILSHHGLYDEVWVFPTETEVTSFLREGRTACSGFLTAWSCVLHLHCACADEFSEEKGLVWWWPLLLGWFSLLEALCWCIAQHWMHQYNTLMYKISKILSLWALQPSVLCGFYQQLVLGRCIESLSFTCWTVVARLNCPWASTVEWGKGRKTMTLSQLDRWNCQRISVVSEWDMHACKHRKMCSWTKW